MSPSAKPVDGEDRRCVELELERNGTAPLLARTAVAGLCREAGASSHAIATVTLLVSEVVTNAVVHPDLDPPGKIGLRARLDEAAIRVEVTDGGSGFTPSLRAPQPLHGGYGLAILAQGSKRWGVEGDPQTTVWFEVENNSS
jgi:anti-sigma regulatory factor (Ser/Thr protein kinase)